MGGFVDVEFIFDGSMLTLYGKNANAFTQVEFSGSIDDFVDELRYEHGRKLSAADLIISQHYVELMKDVPGFPQYSIQVRNWSTGSSSADFSFQNSSNATQFDIKDLQARVRELPEHFRMGEAQ